MTKRNRSPSRVGSATRRNLKPCLVTVSFGDDSEPVMFPVASRADGEARRDEIVAKALEFRYKGLFIKESTDPRFLKLLATDFSEALTPFQRYAAGAVARQALDYYFRRLEEALEANPASSFTKARTFLSLEVIRARAGRTQQSYTVKLPDDYADKLVSQMSTLIAPLFGRPKRSDKANFWMMFTKWIWLNQMTYAMEDLETRIGAEKLAKMRTDKLFARILRRFADSMSAPKEFANLAEYYLEEFSAIVVAPLKEISLNRLEFILGLRTRGGTRDIALRDFSAQIDSLLKQPEKIYSMPARRFEEILAFALSKNGYEEVQLTAQTRDGGYDIAAVRNGVTRQRLIFECKRFSSSRKVGRPLLDALLGVLDTERANQAVLVTTSSFSKDALKLLTKEQWRLQGLDIHKVLELLRQTAKVARG
jgi:hypothetical protein